jgi:hypothetical protein
VPRDATAQAMGLAARLLTKKVGRTARLKITWADGCGWQAGWQQTRQQRYSVPGRTPTEALATLTEALGEMPDLRMRP